MSRSVMLVEDDAAIRMVLRVALEDAVFAETAAPGVMIR